MSEYELRPLQPELLEEAAELACRVRGGTVEQQIAYYDWKYLRNPYIAEPLLHLALRGGRAVGMRGCYGTRWEAGTGGRQYVFPAASDSTILAEHRDGDLYRRLGDVMLADAASRGFTHLVNLSASSHTSLTAILAYGWKGVVPHDVMAIHPPAQRSLASGLRRYLPAPIRVLARKGRGRLGRAVRRHPHAFAALDRSEFRDSDRVVPAIRLTHSAVELADVGRRAGGDHRLQPVRDEEFYRWRFSNPSAAYRFLVAGDETGEACGYLVLCKKATLPSVFVLDWQATSTELADDLLTAALSGGRLTAVSIWSPALSPEQRAILDARGFVPVLPVRAAERRRKSLLVRPVGDPGDDERWVLDGIRLDAASSWNVRATASDSY